MSLESLKSDSFKLKEFKESRKSDISGSVLKTYNEKVSNFRKEISELLLSKKWIEKADLIFLLENSNKDTLEEIGYSGAFVKKERSISPLKRVIVQRVNKYFSGQDALGHEVVSYKTVPEYWMTKHGLDDLVAKLLKVPETKKTVTVLPVNSFTSSEGPGGWDDDF